MEDNTKRTIGIIGTAVTSLFCGCPGLSLLMFGGAAAFVEDTRPPNVIAANEGDPVLGGIILLCMGIFMTAVPIVIAYFTFRRKKPDFDINEPIPPAI